LNQFYNNVAEFHAFDANKDSFSKSIIHNILRIFPVVKYEAEKMSREYCQTLHTSNLEFIEQQHQKTLNDYKDYIKPVAPVRDEKKLCETALIAR
jgi:hypothetical protein